MCMPPADREPPWASSHRTNEPEESVWRPSWRDGNGVITSQTTNVRILTIPTQASPKMLGGVSILHRLWYPSILDRYRHVTFRRARRGFLVDQLHPALAGGLLRSCAVSRNVCAIPTASAPTLPHNWAVPAPTSGGGHPSCSTLFPVRL
ncbi:hypothetical protein GQ53DRAFT_233405 [Thozetella sp. PMI_491]|nr:hypothetical protein GQ53DRAFT_233405 [Thozetella sp. PMI_491]